jgi:hypothetical protein
LFHRDLKSFGGQFSDAKTKLFLKLFSHNLNMSLLLAGVVLFIIGKVAKIQIIETLGFYAMIAGAVLWALSFAGINIPLPI